MHRETPSIGSLARLACEWEVLARKAGNVCPGREFDDLTVADFMNSAAAIEPILDEAPGRPLGWTILRCIEATCAVAATNTNLGIVLLLAPLASVPRDEPLRTGAVRVVRAATVDDTRRVFEAIRLAKPAGLGTAAKEDVNAEPTLPLRDVMALAGDRDQIAAAYADDFRTLFDAMAPDLVQRVAQRGTIEQALVESQLTFMGRWPDSHIARRLGIDEARRVQEEALKVPPVETPEGAHAYRAFDAWLRENRHARNPGTTADFLCAALFVALREGAIAATTPFAWTGHPFEGE